MSHFSRVVWAAEEEQTAAAAAPPSNEEQQPTNEQDEIHRVFAKWDEDKSGGLSRAEIAAGLASLGVPATDESIDALLSKFDSNNDGMLTVEEFAGLVAVRQQEIDKVFELLDVDKSGFLERGEVEQALTDLGIAYDVHSVDRLLKLYDTNGDGRISRQEFQAFLVRVPEALLAANLGYWERAALLNIYADDPGMLPVAPTSVVSAGLINSVAGATASLLSKTSTAPLERLKIMYQMQSTKPPGMWATLSSIYRSEGVSGLFRGNLVNLMKSSPESAVKLAVFEFAKESLEDERGELSPARLFVAGSAGGVSAHVSCFPLEVLKTQMAGSTKAEYTGIMDCVQKLYQHGGARSFYRGLTPVVLSAVPHSGTSLATYQLSKDYFARLSPSGEVGALSLVAAASISTVCGQLVSAPLHVVKTRLIMSGGPGQAHGHGHGHGGADFGNTTMEIIKNTWKREGTAGFFRGLTPTLVKGVPSHAISFLVYEYFRRAWGVEKKKKHH